MEQKVNDPTKKTNDKRPGFATKAVLAASLMVGCTSLQVTNVPYDPGPNGGCTAIDGECSSQSTNLRLADNTAGPNTLNVGKSAVLTLEDVVSDGATMAAKIRIDGCMKGSTEAVIDSKSTVTVTVGSDSFDVTVTNISYDATGPLVAISAVPECPGQQADGGAN